MKVSSIKKILTVAVLFCLCFTCASVAFAHPGGTDEHGGHYNLDTGEYHYHHGYPPHQHKGGSCPYDFDDKTGQNSGSSVGSSSSAKPTTEPNTTGYYSGYFLQEPSTRQSAKQQQKKDTGSDSRIIFAYIFLLLFCSAPFVFVIYLIHLSNKSERESEQKKQTGEY